MPEGDTIHRAAAGLRRALLGATVTAFTSVYPKLTRVDVDTPLVGRTIDDVRAVGKHLLIDFSGGLTLRTHMRMNGSWHIYRPGERWQRPGHAMRIVVETKDFVAVGFDVPEAEFLTADTLAQHEVLTRLGPDLLSPTFDANEALRRVCADSTAEAGEALLDQRHMAGIGNVYKSEILFLCGVNPFTRVGAVAAGTWEKIIETARRVLRANVGDDAPAGLRRTTQRLNPHERLWVYSRGGAPCRRCGTPISFARQGPHARVTYHCPRCQPRA